jgi:hypothetical protein
MSVQMFLLLSHGPEEAAATYLVLPSVFAELREFDTFRRNMMESTIPLLQRDANAELSSEKEREANAIDWQFFHPQLARSGLDADEQVEVEEERQFSNRLPFPIVLLRRRIANPMHNA